jgi:hypothetical protein
MADSPATPMVVGLRQMAGARKPRRTAAVGEQKAVQLSVKEFERQMSKWIEQVRSDLIAALENS